jgi:hypothetical protein
MSPVYSATFPVFNVKDYGAKGDGTTNDTVAIKAAMAAAKATGPVGQGCVFFPDGTYIIDSPLDYLGRYTILGLDCRQTIIKARSVAAGGFTGSQMIRNWQDSDWTGGETDHRVSPAAVATLMVYPRIQGICFQPNDTANLSLIAIRLCNEGSYIRDCQLHAGSGGGGGNTGTRGIDSQRGYQDPLCENTVWYDNNWDRKISIDGIGATVAGSGWEFRHCDLAGNFYTAGVYIRNGFNVDFTDCHIEGGGQSGALAQIYVENTRGVSVRGGSWNTAGVSSAEQTCDYVNCNITAGVGRGGISIRDVTLFSRGQLRHFTPPAVFIRDPFHALDTTSGVVGNATLSTSAEMITVREVTENSAVIVNRSGIVGADIGIPGGIVRKPARANGVAGTTFRETIEMPSFLTNGVSGAASGVCWASVIDLTANDVISHLVAFSGSTAATLGSNNDSHWWFALYDTAATPNLVCSTADQTTAAIAASNAKDLAVARDSAGAAISTYTVPASGSYYFVIMVNVGTGGSPVLPTWAGPTPANTAVTGAWVTGLKRTTFTSGSALTATPPATLATPGNATSSAYAVVYG